MKKYICTVCEYIYDPAQGDPESGIEPGTQCFRSFLRFSSCRAFFVPVFILSGQVLPHRRRHRRRRGWEE